MNQFSLKEVLLSLSTALVLGLVGCSSGGSSDSGGGDGSLSASYSGIGIDGILVGSTVCIDVNQNNACDTGEPSAITDAEGKFNISSTTLTGPLLLLGGVDNSTGAAFTGSLKAPAGSSVVTPLTSAVQSLVESGKSAADAQANVKAAMGLTDVDLTTFDPYAEISGANAAKAQEVLAKQTQLQVLVHAATVTVAGADAGTDVNSTMSSVFDAIVENFSGATSAVVLDATVVSAATKKAADTIYADKPVARVAAKVVAQTSAENSVRDADNAEQTITDGTPSEAVDSLDAAIAKANTTAEAEARLAAENAKTAADALTAEKIAEIEALQKVQQEKEAEIAAARAAQAAAEAELAAAKAAVEADAANREKYEAFLVAQAEAETAAKEKAQANLAAAQAQAAAAEQEALIAAEAAQRQAEAEAAAAQAQAQEAAALLREAAAQQAAAAAQAAVDLEAAKQAAADAQASAAIQIAQAEVNANVQIANFFATQASQDASAARVLADLNITGNLADDNATAAEEARDLAIQAALDANITLPADNNISASIAAKLEAEAQAAVAATALANVQQIKSDAELAAAVLVAQEAKRVRIVTIKDSVVTLFNDANASLSQFDTTQIADNVDFIESVAAAYPANTELQAALVSMQSADTAGGDAYQEAEDLLNDIDSQIALIQAAILNLDEVAAVNASDAALVAKGSLETLFTTITTHVEEIATIRARVEELRDAEIANNTGGGDTNTSVSSVWENGKVIHSFEFRTGDAGSVELRYSDIELSDPNILFTSYGYDFNSSTWIQGDNNDDLSLQDDGSWDAPATYVIETDASILTLNGTEQVALLSAVSVATQTIDITIDEANITIPVTFSEGAVSYSLGFKQLVDAYRLDWTPTDFNTGNPFATLEEYMLKDGNFYWDESSNTGVEVERNADSGAFIDKSGTAITTLTLGDTGNLVTWNSDHNVSTVVGEWEVIHLPNQSSVLTVSSTLNADIPNYDAFMAYGQQFATLYSDSTGTVVRKVELRLASDTFETNTDGLIGNEQAKQDILTAIANFDFSTATTPVTPPNGANTDFLLNVKSIDINSTTMSFIPLTRTAAGFVATTDENEIERNLITVDANNTIVMGAEGTTQVKYLGTLSASEMNSEVNSSFVNAVFYKLAYINNAPALDSWGEVVSDGNNYTTIDGMLNDYVTNSKIYTTSGLPDGQGYIFSSSSAVDSNGTLSIVDFNGTVVTSDAGYFDYNATTIITYKTTDEGQHDAFTLDNGVVVYADYSEAGSGGIAYFGDATALSEFTSYFDNGVDSEVRFGSQEFTGWTAAFANLTAVDPSAIIGTELYEFDVEQNWNTFSLEAFFVGQVVYTMDYDDATSTYYGTTMSFAADSNLAGGTDANGAYGIDAGASDHTYEINGDTVTLVDDENVTTTLTYLYHDDQSNGEQFRLTFLDDNGTEQSIEGPFFDNDQDRDNYLNSVNP